MQSELQAHVQGSFPFLGIARKPGDIITAEELAQASTTARDALVSQKLIVLKPVGYDGVDPGDDRIAALFASFEAIRDEVRALRDSFTPVEGVLVEGLSPFEDRLPAVELAIEGLRGDVAGLKVALPAAVKAAVAEAMKSVNAQHKRHTPKGL